MNIPFSWFSTESPSYPLCITVAPYSSSNTGAPLERTFLSICAFFCAYKRTSENSVPANFAEFHFQKLFDNSKLFLVWAPTSEQKRLKRSHFVVLTATGSRSEGLQRFIKQFLRNCLINRNESLIGPLRPPGGRRGVDRSPLGAKNARSRSLQLFSKQFLPENRCIKGGSAIPVL